MASTGHPLATAAAVRMLEAGGNAFDAGVAAGLALNVVQPEFTNLGGVAPTILYSAALGEVLTISGLGRWPKAMSRDIVESWGGVMPEGVKRAVVPAAADSWLTALKLYGTMTLADVAAPAISLAANGFPVYEMLNTTLTAAAAKMATFPSTAAVFLPNGRPPRVGERLVQTDLANTLELLVEAEAENRHLGREGAIQAARDRFYKGDIADRMIEHVAAGGGYLSKSDLADFSVGHEAPVSTNYRGYDVYACGPWCQGPVVPETLAILSGYDLASFGHNSAEMLHLIIEALKASFADRERYYADPDFSDVPIDALLRDASASAWRDRISPDHAFPGMPEPGDASRVPVGDFERSAARDTSYLCVVDQWGNAYSATPSDGVGTTPLVPGLGFVVSDRGSQSWLDPEHPCAIAPWHRPRLTPAPGLVMKDGKVFAPFGTPGGDVQPQAMVQFLVNLIDFGMDAQAAVEAPRVATYSFPDSFYPHTYAPGQMKAEGRIGPEVIEALRAKGHQVEVWGDFVRAAGSLNAIVVDEGAESLQGAADPRRTGYAMGW
jgi:gamma-glutamyltranspeptidase/glutathione hydrolase